MVRDVGRLDTSIPACKGQFLGMSVSTHLWGLSLKSGGCNLQGEIARGKERDVGSRTQIKVSWEGRMWVLQCSSVQMAAAHH